MDFIYYGEANIYQNDLDGFLALAEELQLKGLAKSEDATVDEAQEATPKPQAKKPIQQRIPKVINTNQEPLNIEHTKSLVPINVGKALMTIDPSNEDIKVMIDSLLERDMEGEYRCTVCGKTNKGSDAKKNMKQHIETHFEGVSHTCNQCEKVTRSSSSLRMHIYRNHGK